METGSSLSKRAMRVSFEKKLYNTGNKDGY